MTRVFCTFARRFGQKTASGPAWLRAAQLFSAGFLSIAANCASTSAEIISDRSCEDVAAYTVVENKVHRAACRGDRIVLEPTESLDAAFLVRAIITHTSAQKFKERGFRLQGGRIAGEFRLQNLRFDMPAFSISATFEDIVDFSDSEFTGTVHLQDSKFARGLLASRVVIRGSLKLGDTDDTQYDGGRAPGGSYAAFVRAPHARISGDVVVAGATIGEDLRFSNAQIGGSLSIMYATASRIGLWATEIGNQLVFYNCAIRGQATGQNWDRSALNLYSIRTKQSVYINRTSIQGGVSLGGAEIAGDLILLGSELSSLHARSSKVAGTLGLGLNKGAAANSGEPDKWTRWIGQSELDLTNANFGGFRSPEQIGVWPNNIYFHNLSYRSFSPDFCDGPVCRHDTTWFATWLGKQADDRKTYGPYKTTVDILLGQGQILEAYDLAIRGHDAERDDAYRHGEWIRYTLLTLHRYTVGYGYRLYWVIYWIAGFVLLGSLVFRRTPEARLNGMPYGLSYSFDLLVPLMKLRPSHYEIDIQGGARYYFYFHKLVGWALSLILVATVSGITK